MVFSSLTFLFLYLPLTLLVYFLSPLKWRNFILLAVSLLFYGWGEPVYIVIMFLSIAIDYTHGLLVEKYRDNDRKARWFVAQSVIFNLLLLGFFKYGTFFAENLYALTGLQIPPAYPGAGADHPSVGRAPAHRHLLLHLPDHVLHHRRVPQGRAGPAERGGLRHLRHHVPPADRRPSSSTRRWRRSWSAGSTRRRNSPSAPGGSAWALPKKSCWPTPSGRCGTSAWRPRGRGR